MKINSCQKQTYFLVNLLFLLSLVVFKTTYADDLAKNWQGEWGQWTAVGGDNYAGANISIDCTNYSKDNPECHFEFASTNNKSTCDGSGEGSLKLVSTTQAEAEIDNEGAKQSHHKVKLFLKKMGTNIYIQVIKERKKDCGFVDIYPLKTHDLYGATDTEKCYADSSKATQLWCKNGDSIDYYGTFDIGCYEDKISSTMQQWCNNPEINTLRAKIFQIADEHDYTKLEEWQKQTVNDCEKSKIEPDQCLKNYYAQLLAQLQNQAKKSELEEFIRVQQEGDINQASKMIDQVEGDYTYKPGILDYNGHPSTEENSLTIFRVSQNTIYFYIYMNFTYSYDCELEGIAKYNADKQFVFINKNPDVGDINCALKIIPSAKGIMLENDDTSCNYNCGFRQSYNGTFFAASLRKPFIKNSSLYRDAQDNYISYLQENGPSYDCRKATTEIEKNICTNNYLASLDKQIADKISNKNNNYTPKNITELEESQKTWLKDRNNCILASNLTDCLQAKMKERLNQL